MQYAQQKKRLMKESGIFVALCAVLAGGAYYLGTVDDDYQQHNTDLQAEVNGIRTESNMLRDKFTRAQQNTSLYQEALQKSTQGGFSLNRQTMRDKFNQYKGHYYLNNLHMAISGIDDLKDPQYKHKTHTMVSSNVELGFEALSDEDVYSLLNAMQQELSGSTRITKLSMTRTGEVSEETLHVIRDKGEYAMLACVVKFTWLGANPVVAGNATADAAKNGP